MPKFQPGDRVEGLYRHKGRKATIIECGQSSARVRFDDGKKNVCVEALSLKAVEASLLSSDGAIDVNP